MEDSCYCGTASYNRPTPTYSQAHRIYWSDHRPRGTGKSHIYKEISPNSILISGGQTTVPNLFYNMATNKVGLVGLWDVCAFDEVAGIKFKDADGVQIMKDYMASGSFTRGRDLINANAAMVFVGNLNQSVDTLVKTGHFSLKTYLLFLMEFSHWIR